MWHIMRDPDYWEDADDFKPERFLDEYGKYKRDERNIPFMLGKRVCIGQNVARNSMFLFFTSILQKYELRAPNGPENVQTRFWSFPRASFRPIVKMLGWVSA